MVTGEIFGLTNLGRAFGQATIPAAVMTTVLFAVPTIETEAVAVSVVVALLLSSLQMINLSIFPFLSSHASMLPGPRFIFYGKMGTGNWRTTSPPLSFSPSPPYPCSSINNNTGTSTINRIPRSHPCNKEVVSIALIHAF